MKDHAGSYGWIVLVALAVGYDVAVMHKGLQSLSAAIWDVTGHEFYEPAILGLWTALTYHFFIEKRKGIIR